MTPARRIYCIEGVWDYGKDMVEPSVEPLLELLHRQGRWNYVRRDCATAGELKYYLDEEWWKRCCDGSVLYLATHGDRDSISLNRTLGLDELGDMLEGRCEHCLVHIGGCEVLGGNEDAVMQRVKAFLHKTKAMGVSGFGAEVYWTDALWAPAVALELMLFSSIGKHREPTIDLTNGKHFSRLGKVVKKLQHRFPDCRFDLYTRLDERIR